MKEEVVAPSTEQPAVASADDESPSGVPDPSARVTLDPATEVEVEEASPSVDNTVTFKADAAPDSRAPAPPSEMIPDPQRQSVVDESIAGDKELSAQEPALATTEQHAPTAVASADHESPLGVPDPAARVALDPAMEVEVEEASPLVDNTKTFKADAASDSQAPAPPSEMIPDPQRQSGVDESKAEDKELPAQDPAPDLLLEEDSRDSSEDKDSEVSRVAAEGDDPGDSLGDETMDLVRQDLKGAVDSQKPPSSCPQEQEQRDSEPDQVVESSQSVRELNESTIQETLSKIPAVKVAEDNREIIASADDSEQGHPKKRVSRRGSKLAETVVSEAKSQVDQTDGRRSNKRTSRRAATVDSTHDSEDCSKLPATLADDEGPPKKRRESQSVREPTESATQENLSKIPAVEVAEDNREIIASADNSEQSHPKKRVSRRGSKPAETVVSEAKSQVDTEPETKDSELEKQERVAAKATDSKSELPSEEDEAAKQNKALGSSEEAVEKTPARRVSRRNSQQTTTTQEHPAPKRARSGHLLDSILLS